MIDLDEVKKLLDGVDGCLNLLDGLVAESGRGVEWGEEDAFRMGEWFEDHDIALIAATRAASRQLVPDMAQEIADLRAEVARLSTPPDDADVAELVERLHSLSDELWWRPLAMDAADALTRLSHAHAARRRPDAGKGCIHTTPCTCGEPE